MTIETPKPYGWIIEGTPLIWRGKHAIADAKSYGRNWRDNPEPIPLYREPPVTEKSSAAQSERKWNELSPNDILAAVSISLLNSYEHPNRLLDFARFLELVLKEKNQ